MFTIPAIHHAAIRGDDGAMGTMHLNALNGSSNVLGHIDPSFNNNNSFGGLFGVSLSDNHPYRPQDSGMTFHESSKNSHKSSTSSTKSTSSSYSSSSSARPAASSSLSSSSSSSSSSKEMSSTHKKFISKKADTMSSLRGTETASPVGPRRRSLDLDTASTNSCCRYDDRSLSLDELVYGPFLRRGCHVGDVINEHDLPCDLDLTGLSITEVQINTEAHNQDKDEHQCVNGHHHKCAHAHKKKRRSHTTDAATSERAIRLLEKIKDTKRGHHHTCNSKNCRGDCFDNDDRPEDHKTSSKSGHTRHNILRHLSDSAQQKIQHESRKHKDKKLLSHASVE